MQALASKKLGIFKPAAPAKFLFVFGSFTFKLEGCMNEHFIGTKAEWSKIDLSFYIKINTC